jgi:hypothetical protein
MKLTGYLNEKKLSVEEATVQVSKVLAKMHDQDGRGRSEIGAHHLGRVASGLKPSHRLALAISRWSKGKVTLADLGIEVQ